MGSLKAALCSWLQPGPALTIAAIWETEAVGRRPLSLNLSLSVALTCQINKSFKNTLWLLNNVSVRGGIYIFRNCLIGEQALTSIPAFAHTAHTLKS